MRLLMICPSRNRPDRIKEMLDSFDKTKSSGTELIIYISEDDYRLSEYKESLKGRDFIIGPRRSISEVYNYIACEKMPNWLYYGLIDDDHIFITPNWDSCFIEAIEKAGGFGLACGIDRLTDWEKFQHPSGCVIDGRVIRALGYFIYPAIRHIGVDMFLGKLFMELGRLHRLTDVIIEHRHRINNMAQDDSNYQQVYSAESISQGVAAFEEWRDNFMQDDLAKIRKEIECAC